MKRSDFVSARDDRNYVRYIRLRDISSIGTRDTATDGGEGMLEAAITVTCGHTYTFSLKQAHLIMDQIEDDEDGVSDGQ